MSTTSYTKKSTTVDSRKMAYVDEGQGDCFLFIHGNPTSSYLWRNVIREVVDKGRCVAPDLIGMGDSEKLENPGPDRYTFAEHSAFLDGFIDAVLPDEPVWLVIHDWGSALGFDWARRHPDRVKGIAYMEAVVMPLTWDDWPKAATEIFQGFRSPNGEDLVLEKNLFIEGVLPMSVIRTLEDEEMNEYRRPFVEGGETRRPMLTWPRQIPLENEPAEVVAVASAYGEWLATSEVPKLFVNADPGAILRGRQREFCRSWPNQTEVTVKGIHFIQEDSATEIGQAINKWFDDVNSV